MKYRLTAARMLASSYGAPFAPSPGHVPHLLAANFDNADVMFETLKQQQRVWESDDVASALMAMHRAHTAVANALAAALHQPATLEDVEVSYRPILDKNGNEIGHDTVSWLMVDGIPVVKEFKDAAGDVTLGLIACVYLAVVPA